MVHFRRGDGFERKTRQFPESGVRELHHAVAADGQQGSAVRREGGGLYTADLQAIFLSAFRPAEEAQQAGQLAYMSRAIIMATLPRSKPKSLEFTRTSGNYTLVMHIASALSRDTGTYLPYGTIPRLIFLWITTALKLTKEPVLNLGETRSAFMRNVGLTPRTGKRGNMKEFTQQFKNLLATTLRRLGQIDALL